MAVQIAANQNSANLMVYRGLRQATPLLAGH